MQKFTTHFPRISKTIRDIFWGLFLLLCTIGGAVGLGNILDTVPLFVSFDRFFYEKINLGPHPAWLDVLVSPFNFNFLPWGGTFIPSFLYFVFLFGLLYIAIRHRPELLWACVALLVAAVIDTVLFKITSAYVMRDRPFLHLANNVSADMQNIWSHWPTYPSGHVRDLALYSTVLAGYAPELRLPFIFFTLWLVFTRVYLGAHYPTDTLAGWAIGYLAGVATLLLISPLRAHYLTERARKQENP